MNKEYVPKIKKTIKRFTYVFIIELLIFLIFVGYQFFIWRKNINRLNILSNELSNKSVEFVNLSNMEKEIDDLIKNYDEIFNKIVNNREELNILSEFIIKTQDFNLKIVDMNIYEKTKILEDKENYQKLLFDATIQGNINSIVNFLNWIENKDKIMAIVNLNMDNLLKNGDYEIYLEISIPIFYESEITS